MMSNSEEPQGNAAKPDGEAASTPSASQAPRARLTRLMINRFRNVKSGTELRFDDGINVLLGRNGTGKTTLLELVCAVVRGDLRAYQYESFDLEFDVRLADYCFTVSAQYTTSLAQRLAYLGTREQPRSWKYSIDIHGPSGRAATMEATPQAATITGSEDVREGIIVEGVSLFSTAFYVAPFLDRWIHSSLIEKSFISIVRSCLRLDEGLDVFRSIVGGSDLPYVGQLSIERFSTNNARSLAWYVPHELVRHLVAQGPSLHESTDIAVYQADFPTLDTVAQAIAVGNVHCSLMLLDRKRDPESGTTVSRFGKPSFWITTHRGTTFTHDKLSYGEKRLLAFMYHAACNPQILVADELVNGLHHGWIQACLDAIQGQAFLTSQNPLLLDYLPFASAEEVQRRFILCDRDEHGDWIWRNMDEDAAGAFYRAYKVGIQHVSEILETKGLW